MVLQVWAASSPAREKIGGGEVIKAPTQQLWDRWTAIMSNDGLAGAPVQGLLMSTASQPLLPWNCGRQFRKSVSVPDQRQQSRAHQVKCSARGVCLVIVTLPGMATLSGSRREVMKHITPRVRRGPVLMQRHQDPSAGTPYVQYSSGRDRARTAVVAPSSAPTILWRFAGSASTVRCRRLIHATVYSCTQVVGFHQQRTPSGSVM